MGDERRKKWKKERADEKMEDGWNGEGRMEKEEVERAGVVKAEGMLRHTEMESFTTCNNNEAAFISELITPHPTFPLLHSVTIIRCQRSSCSLL